MTAFPTIVIEGFVPDERLSPNKKLHHMVKYRAMHRDKLIVQAYVNGSGWPMSRGAEKRRRLTITIHGLLMMDVGNLMTRCKGVIDAVVDAGRLYDGSPRYCEVVVKQERAPRKARKTVLEMEETDDAQG